MSKIPVGKTISDAYGYGVGQFPANLGITWLPLFLLLAAIAFGLPLYFAAISHMMTTLKPAQPGTMPDLSGLMTVYRYIFLFYLLEVLLLAQITLGMTRRALGMDQGPVFFFLSIGTTYWRLVGAYLIMIVIQIAVVIAVEIVAAIVGIIVAVVGGVAVAGSHPGTSAAVGMGALAVLGVIALVVGCILVMAYIMSRLTFLLTPAIVAEDRFALMRSWELTKGSFWRMVVIAIAIFGPTLIVALIVEGILFGAVGQSIIHALPAPGQSNDPQATAQAMNTVLGALMGAVKQYWYLLVAFWLFLSTLTYGLMMGAAASAYRSQTEGTIPATFS